MKNLPIYKIAEYQAAGLDLTLRQLYYQFVARGLIDNKDSEYKRLGSIINDARLAGEIDWNAINDRTRNVHRLSTWADPAAIVRSAHNWFMTDAWDDQDCRIEVWIEKDALAGVIAGVCDELRVPYFACRGYVSQSEMWAAGVRLHQVASIEGKTPHILHLGDHDPSGLDMSRDIEERVRLFMTDPDGGDDQSDALEFERLALNMNQIVQYAPPPNPAKQSDIRYQKYVKKYDTTNSWELDALDPKVIVDLVRRAILQRRDEKAWKKSMAEEDKHRGDLGSCHERWAEVIKLLRKPCKPKKRRRRRGR